MSNKSEKFYITTSIAYVNAAPHIGFALESVQADAIARWHRQEGLPAGRQGEEVFFLTGADEHGAKIARAAEAAGKTPRELVDENSEKFKALKDALNLSWDNFIRTSDQKIHWPVAQELWKRIAEAGDLYKKTYKGLYCVGHEAFVTQKDLSPVRGKSPEATAAAQLRASNGMVCKDHQTAPEVLEEENWFFKLSKYTGEIESRIKNQELKIVPETRKNEVLAFLKEGLEDISFSRPSKDLTWGIPVPGDETQTMYVWADALSNYISGYGLQQWEKHPADIHVVGKDILRFHAVIWPAMLLSAKLPLPKTIFVHGHILAGGQKMSKSLGNVVDPFELVKKYGADAVRYFLLREIPSSEDGDFSYEKFAQRYNADLANGLGNYAARVLTLAEQVTSDMGQGTLDGGQATSTEDEVELKINEVKKLVDQKLGEFKLNEALAAIWELIQFGDRYVNEKKPWDKSVSEEDKKTAIFNAVVILKNVGELLQPFLPDTSEKITKSITWEKNILKVKKIENLFPRV